MNIGFIGLGKLGMPIAQAIASKGYKVKGYDILPKAYSKEVEQATIQELVQWADLIFAAPQTPHKAEFEGATRIPVERADFDYRYLKLCVLTIEEEAERQKRKVNLVVVSTCLPGTYNKQIKPLLNKYVNYIYEPLFIAMGTEKQDFLNPEFVLIGGDKPNTLVKFYKKIHKKPILKTNIITAEGIKVAYNTWITAKTVIANIWGEIAQRTGMNFDDIYKSWTLSTDRILSPRYMRAGMSDGGACHPRDNIALSWLAREIKLSHDIFQDLMFAREDFEEYHADLAIRCSKEKRLPLILLGKAFKPDTDIQTGSAALLMANILREKGYPFSHHEDLTRLPAAVYFIATDHKRYRDYKFSKESIVINPFNIGRWK